MKRLMRWASRLYPASWRARYGDELQALLEDAGPRWTDVLDILRGALGMHMTRLNFWKIAAGFAIAGALTAAAWSLTLPDRYVSRAVLKVTDPRTGATLDSDPETRRRLQTLEQFALNRHSLSHIIQEQKLYQKDLASKPLEDVVQAMRMRDLGVTAGSSNQITVSFANQDPAAAQATVRALVSALVEENFARRGPVTLEVIEPASMPAGPDGPNRWRVIRNGLMLGLVVGVLLGALYTLVRGRRDWSFLRIGAFAAAGMAIGLAIAMSMPDQYVSIAVLRTARADNLPAARDAAFSESSLHDVILKFDLYPNERRSTPMNKVVGKMRDTAIQVRTVTMPGSGLRVFTVAFTYPDRYKAEAVTRELVARIGGAVTAEVLDPPSTPSAPSSPNRWQIAAFGLLAGTLLGLAASRSRRAPLATA